VSLSRRDALRAVPAGAATLVSFGIAHGMTENEMSSLAKNFSYLIDDEEDNVIRRNVHEGKGEIDVKFFTFKNESNKMDGLSWPSSPALLIIYTIPPGASEGVHTHLPGDSKEGSFDEFYYIVQGSGVMEIDGEKIDVNAGDHVFTPNGIPHGIENTSQIDDLKVFLTAVSRD